MGFIDLLVTHRLTTPLVVNTTLHALAVCARSFSGTNLQVVDLLLPQDVG